VLAGHHVRPILLGAADRHQDSGLAGTYRGGEFRGCQVLEEDARRRLRERRCVCGKQRNQEPAQRRTAHGRILRDVASLPCRFAYGGVR